VWKINLFSESINRDLEYLNAHYKRCGFYKLREKLLSQIEFWGFKRFGNLKLLKTVKTSIGRSPSKNRKCEQHELDDFIQTFFNSNSN